MSAREEIVKMEYDVIHTTLSMKGLIKKVNKAIKEGWRPQGGVCVDAGYGWAQAMTRDGK
jgi:hypothetical protein